MYYCLIVHLVSAKYDEVKFSPVKELKELMKSDVVATSSPTLNEFLDFPFMRYVDANGGDFNYYMNGNL